MAENQKGFDSIAQQLESYSSRVQKGVANEIKASAFTIAANAKRAAAKDTGRLAQLITVKNGSTPYDTEVISGADYSAYVEFGTGSRVNIPNGFEAIAALARGRNIRQRNYPAHPFLIPAFQDEKPKLLERIKNVIENG